MHAIVRIQKSKCNFVKQVFSFQLSVGSRLNPGQTGCRKEPVGPFHWPLSLVYQQSDHTGVQMSSGPGGHPSLQATSHEPSYL